MICSPSCSLKGLTFPFQPANSAHKWKLIHSGTQTVLGRELERESWPQEPERAKTHLTHFNSAGLLAHMHAELTCLDLFPAAERCSCILFIHGMGSKPQLCLEFYRIYQAGTFHWILFGSLDRIYVVKKT